MDALTVVGIVVALVIAVPIALYGHWQREREWKDFVDRMNARRADYVKRNRFTY